MDKKLFWGAFYHTPLNSFGRLPMEKSVKGFAAMLTIVLSRISLLELVFLAAIFATKCISLLDIFNKNTHCSEAMGGISLFMDVRPENPSW